MFRDVSRTRARGSVPLLFRHAGWQCRLVAIEPCVPAMLRNPPFYRRLLVHRFMRRLDAFDESWAYGDGFGLRRLAQAARGSSTRIDGASTDESECGRRPMSLGASACRDLIVPATMLRFGFGVRASALTSPPRCRVSRLISELQGAAG